MKTFYQLVSVVEPQTIDHTEKTAFMRLLRQAILLSLKDSGYLTDMQYRYAEEEISSISYNKHPLRHSNA